MIVRRCRWSFYRPYGLQEWDRSLLLGLANTLLIIGGRVSRARGCWALASVTYSHISGARIVTLRLGFCTFTMRVAASCLRQSFTRLDPTWMIAIASEYLGKNS